MAHPLRKSYDLHNANKSELAVQALEYIGQLYQVKREAKDLPLDKRQSNRDEKARPIADAMRCINGCWLIVRKCRMAQARPKPWITALNAGKR